MAKMLELNETIELKEWATRKIEEIADTVWIILDQGFGEVLDKYIEITEPTEEEFKAIKEVMFSTYFDQLAKNAMNFISE